MSYLDTLRRVMDGGYDDASQQERDDAVREVIQMCSAAAGAVSVQPIPMLDIALISPIQIVMVQAIGRIHGHSLDKKAVLEIVSTFGASILAQNVIMATAKLIPFVGWIAAVAMSYALTWAIGEVSEHYFRNGRGVPQEELREMFDRVYKSKKAEKHSAVKKNSSLKERLEQLKDAKAEGLLTDEEFEEKKREMLADF